MIQGAQSMCGELRGGVLDTSITPITAKTLVVATLVHSATIQPQQGAAAAASAGRVAAAVTPTTAAYIGSESTPMSLEAIDSSTPTLAVTVDACSIGGVDDGNDIAGATVGVSDGRGAASPT